MQFSTTNMNYHFLAFIFKKLPMELILVKKPRFIVVNLLTVIEGFI